MLKLQSGGYQYVDQRHGTREVKHPCLCLLVPTHLKKVICVTKRQCLYPLVNYYNITYMYMFSCISNNFLFFSAS
jgi:hypothetical protein